MSRDPLDAKAVYAADPDPTGAERAAAVWLGVDLAGIEASIDDIARMTRADITRKLDDLEAPRDRRAR